MKPVLLLPCALALSAQAQNVVLDPGLVDTLRCPQTIGRFYHPTNTAERYTEHWRATTLASPDYHHTCGFNGYQPRTGDGYAGIVLYDPTEYREYITALMEPLIAGNCYYLESWMALSTGTIMAVDSVQFNFNATVPLSMAFPPPGPLALTAHLQAWPGPASASYERVSGFYMASGGETALTIGNFRNNASTTVTQVGSSGQIQSYYFIDDVTVTRLDLGGDQVICPGEQALIVPNIQNDALTYTWSDGSGGMTLTTGIPGTYTLTISGAGGCSATAQVAVVLDPCAGISDASAHPPSGVVAPVARGEDVRIAGLRLSELAGLFATDGREMRATFSADADAVLIGTGHLTPGAYVLRASDGRAWRCIVR